MSPQGSPESGGPQVEIQTKQSRRRVRRALRSPRPWLRAVPFFASALLFLSGIFSLFAPIPLLLVGISTGPLAALAAGLVNAALIHVLGGASFMLFYGVSVIPVGVVMSYFLKTRRLGLEATLGWTWGALVALLILVVSAYAVTQGMQPTAQLQLSLNEFFDWLIASVNPENRKQLFGELTPEDWKAKSMVELPTALLTVAAIGIWMNLTLLITLMGRPRRAELGLDRKSFFRWRNADWVIWPTLAVWAAFLLVEGVYGEIAFGWFKFFLVLYAIQGLAVLGGLFEAWKVRGAFRLALYFIAVSLVLPLVVSIGFFDHWFDFRARIRQS